MHGDGAGELGPRAAVHRQLREGGGHAPGAAADRALAQDPARAWSRVSPAEQRGAWERTGALLAGSATTSIERDPDYGLAQLEFLQTWLRGIYEESLHVPDRSRLEPLTRQMAAAGRYLVPPKRRARAAGRRAATTAPGSWRCGTRSTCW